MSSSTSWNPPSNFHKVVHPLVQVRLAALRDVTTQPSAFRTAVHELSRLLLFEATRDLSLTPTTVRTPLAETTGARLDRPVTLVPILRAGLGMMNGMVDAIPEALVGHVGLARDEETAEPKEYYCKLPPDVDRSEVIVLDPMLATGGSGCHAINALKRAGARSLRFACILASREGVETLANAHPDVPIFGAAVDPELDGNAFIVPGLGDAGDRYFGTVPST